MTNSGLMIVVRFYNSAAVPEVRHPVSKLRVNDFRVAGPWLDGGGGVFLG